MTKQNQWLFEAPILTTSSLTQEYYSNPAWEAEWELQQDKYYGFPLFEEAWETLQDLEKSKAKPSKRPSKKLKPKLPKQVVQAEYPLAEWKPAAMGNFSQWNEQSLRPIDKIIIHITDGTTLESTINWFTNPKQLVPVIDRKTGKPVIDPKTGKPKVRQINVSAHYVIGQNGKVVQMVKHNDIAHHANNSNRSSIGIEHVACTGKDKKICSVALPPTQAQLCSSAALVNWLCKGFGIPMDRQHILGHSEADLRTTHGCPSSLWNWQYYMNLVTSGQCFPLSTKP